MTPAHALAELGLSVLPLKGKIPASKHGYLDATCDPDDVAAMLAAYPVATNLGLQPGMCGLLVVDLDEVKEVGTIPAYVRLQQVAEEHGGLPDTLTVRTGSGGRHLYFKAPARSIGQKNGILNPETGRTESGVDVRGTKGYVVCPPSVHPKTKKGYVWETPSGEFGWEHVREMPAWLLDFIDPPEGSVVQLAVPDWEPPSSSDMAQRRVEGMVHRVCDEIASLGPGMSRRTELQRAAHRLGGLLWTGYPRAALHGSLCSAALACGHYDGDTDRAIRMGIDAGMQKPYDLPPDSDGWNDAAQQKQNVREALREWAARYRVSDEEEVVLPEIEELDPDLPDPAVVTMLELSRGKDGEEGAPKAHMVNAAAVIEHDRRQKGRWWRDDWAQTDRLDEDEQRDVDVQELRAWLHRVYGFLPSTTAAEEAVQLVSSRNRRDPHREWLEGLYWDGEGRLEDMLSSCFGVEDTPLSRAMGRKWMISAVARALRPGCQVDNILVLKGLQGAGKTTGLRALAGPKLFAAPAIVPGSKETVLALQGSWIIEWAELANLRRSEVNLVKSFISEMADKVRVPYARRPVVLPRRCVFAATTNDQEILSDTTGDRRFWVVETGPCDLRRIEELREQLWAEAVARLGAGEEWHLTPEEDALRDEANAAYRYEDPWVPIAEAWIEHHGDAQGFDLEALLYDRGSDGYAGYSPPGFSLARDKVSQFDRSRAKRILRDLGYSEQRRRVNGVRERRWYHGV